MRRDLALWFGLLTGPAIWFLVLQTNFALAPWTCAYQWKAAVYAVSLAGLAVTTGAGLLSWSQWRRLGATNPGEAGGAIARSRAMAMGGVLLSAMSFLVILAQTLPDLILGCE